MKKYFTKTKMKEIVVYLGVLFFVCGVFAFANQTFIAPSGIQYAYDRDGNGYAVSSSGTISVPIAYINDFVKGGYLPLPATLSGGTAAASSNTALPNTKIYSGSVPATLGTNPNTATVTGLGFANSNFVCTANDASNSLAVKPAVLSTTSASFTFSAATNDVINYTCIGQ